MSWDSFNLGDVFLLDLGKVIIQWNGPESNTRERLKAMLLAKDIRDRERGGRAEIRVVDGDQEGASPELTTALQSVLGDRPRKIKPSTPDEVVDQQQKATVLLYRGWGPLAGPPGRPPDRAPCRFPPPARQEFINMKGYPYGTNVETVNDGAESAMFKQLFQTWAVRDQTVGLGRASSLLELKFDATLLHARPELAAQERMVDNGEGKVEVWRIENLELAPVESQWHGFFYGGDCYLVLYTYGVNHQPRYILYIWQGRHATPDELAASAYQAVEVDRQFDGEPVQVRVSMGKEPRHFLAIFKGKLVIFEVRPRRTGAGSNEPEPPVRLFQIHGTDQSNTKAVEVPAFASSLNSNDVFLLRTQTEHYLWYGKVRAPP
uniref:Advillin n=1 Tax=Terrapene triunguis TaxID=2587831 RepID=A0A674I8M5_9SAUR